jgi:hypothetical protein
MDNYWHYDKDRSNMNMVHVGCVSFCVGYILLDKITSM